MTILALILGVALIWTVIACMGAAQWLRNAADRSSFFRRWWTLIALLLVVRALQLLGVSAEGSDDPSNPPWLETLVAEEWGEMAGTVILAWGILFLFSGIRAIRRPVAKDSPADDTTI